VLFIKIYGNKRTKYRHYEKPKKKDQTQKKKNQTKNTQTFHSFHHYQLLPVHIIKQCFSAFTKQKATSLFYLRSGPQLLQTSFCRRLSDNSTYK